MADDRYGLVVDAGVEVPVPGDGETWTVGAVVLDGRGRAFAQRRGAGRRLFPDCWDIVGGHVEAGESLLEALAREVREETGWRLRRVRRLLGVGPSTPPTTGSAPAIWTGSRRTGRPASTWSTT
ncbi:NUDIX hydrolase [Streptomyces griseosporeus]